MFLVGLVSLVWLEKCILWKFGGFFFVSFFGGLRAEKLKKLKKAEKA